MNKEKAYFIFVMIFIIGRGPVYAQDINVPKQDNHFILIYKPAGDSFYGPDTKHLKTGQWYQEWVPNDHTFVKGADGRWHIFGITHPLVQSNPLHVGIHEGEYASFHAVAQQGLFHEVMSNRSFVDKPKILTPNDRPSEILANHAPFIIKKDRYFMVYGPNPIRLAVSSDLQSWQLRGPLFDDSDGARDPNVLLYKGTYYLVYCSLREIRLRKSKDFTHWSTPEVIFQSNKFDPESPTLLFLNDAFYLFVCAWDGHWDEKDIQGAYQHKTYVYRSVHLTQFGIDDEKQITVLNAHAPEIFKDEEGQWYISSAEWPNRGVSVDKLRWIAP